MEFSKTIYGWCFLIKLTQFEKIGSIGNFLIPLGNLNIKILYWNLEVHHVFVTLHFCYSIVEFVCFLKLGHTKTENTKTYKRVFTKFITLYN